MGDAIILPDNFLGNPGLFSFAKALKEAYFYTFPSLQARVKQYRQEQILLLLRIWDVNDHICASAKGGGEIKSAPEGLHPAFNAV